MYINFQRGYCHGSALFRYRKLQFPITKERSAKMRTRAMGIMFLKQPRSARECAKAHSFLFDLKKGLVIFPKMAYYNHVSGEKW